MKRLHYVDHTVWGSHEGESTPAVCLACGFNFVFVWCVLEEETCGAVFYIIINFLSVRGQSAQLGKT